MLPAVFMRGAVVGRALQSRKHHLPWHVEHGACKTKAVLGDEPWSYCSLGPRCSVSDPSDESLRKLQPLRSCSVPPKFQLWVFEG